MTNILIIEDDLKLAKLVQEFLNTNGIVSSIEPNGEVAVDRILKERPDMVILDLLLPGLDGISVCRKVRDRYPNPILMLTAKSAEVDEIIGLEVGADDYMAKPVKPRLLLARINALLRRASNEHTNASLLPLNKDRYVFESLIVDVKTRSVTLNGNEVDLTTSEFELLHYMVQHSGEVLERDELYKNVRGIEWDGIDRSIDARIVRLRQKLGDDARSPRIIKSVRGVGYLLAVTS